MNYFEFYPGDYLRDTSRLRLIEHGAYLRLLLAYYSEEEPLPAEMDELFTICAATNSAEKAAVKKVAERFFPVGEDGTRRKGRVEEEISKAKRRIETSRRNGTQNRGKTRQPTQQPTQQVTQQPTQGHTCSGEALPHATCHTPKALPTTLRADRSSKGEPLALALQEMGWEQCSAGDPYIQRAVEAGVTVDELRAAAAGKSGKPLAYVVERALGRRRDATEAPAAAPPATVSPATAEGALRRALREQRAKVEASTLIAGDERSRRLAAIDAELERLQAAEEALP